MFGLVGCSNWFLWSTECYVCGQIHGGETSKEWSILPMNSVIAESDEDDGLLAGFGN